MYRHVLVLETEYLLFRASVIPYHFVNTYPLIHETNTVGIYDLLHRHSICQVLQPCRDEGRPEGWKEVTRHRHYDIK